ncbi:hypothetical protein Rhe02_49920 [Rhizocola hellebori]|uniref:Uncharacterized protein n=1 Tax=Rhizocola hellebori TaxID=1392758 RepID=A0A8J3VHW2_9ACTN|nr:hypothetical protein [Rhizocola hellebori]GIH06925.1 hypothetical protein Rhe02_49920 [Rhizocola hellebori]
MIRLGLRCLPSHGRHDLAWLARLTGSLQEIYEFLLRTEIGAHLAADRDLRRLTDDERQLVIDGQAIEAGSPLVKVRAGSTRVELRTRAPDGTPVQALACLALMLESGPEVAAWPGHVKQAWFGESLAAARARQAHDWIRRSAVVHIVQDGSSGKSVKKRRKGEDLPAGVRRSPPLA